MISYSGATGKIADEAFALARRSSTYLIIAGEPELSGVTVNSGPVNTVCAWTPYGTNERSHLRSRKRRRKSCQLHGRCGYGSRTKTKKRSASSQPNRIIPCAATNPGGGGVRETEIGKCGAPTLAPGSHFYAFLPFSVVAAIAGWRPPHRCRPRRAEESSIRLK